MIEFWYEFASTYSYPAAMRIQRLADGAGVAVRWHPFLLAPIFNAQGWNDSPFNIYLMKGAYMWRDLARICAKEGLRWWASRKAGSAPSPAQSRVVSD